MLKIHELSEGVLGQITITNFGEINYSYRKFVTLKRINKFFTHFTYNF